MAASRASRSRAFSMSRSMTFCPTFALSMMVARAFGARETLPHILALHGFLMRLAGEDHERPAPMMRPHLHGHAGLLRLAELAQIGKIRARALQFRVDHQ